MTRTRIAPSPTGFPHIGTIYQAIFDRAVADQNMGKMVVRIEDTDQKRFVAGSEEIIFKSLAWAGINVDESPEIGGKYGPYRQSERLPLYQEYVRRLVDLGGAYYCFCSSERLEEVRKKQGSEHKPTAYDKHCRNLSAEEVKNKIDTKDPFVIRLKVPENTQIVVRDSIRGEVIFQSNLIDDGVLLKSDGFPTYHLALVVDDRLMEITHPIRGEEWISSYPKHKLIYDYFGWEMPIYTHLPLLRNPDGSKIAKRHGHTSVEWYRTEGILPGALVNYLSLLVWNHPEGKEIYGFDEFTKYLDLKNISLTGPRFDLKKLEWMNGEYIRSTENARLAIEISKYLKEYSSNVVLKTLTLKDLQLVVPLIKERIKKLSEFELLAKFLFMRPEPLQDHKFKYLNKIKEVSEALPKPWNREVWEKDLRKLAQDLGVKPGEVFMDLRIAVSGSKVGPDLFDSIKFIGEAETLNRLRDSIKSKKIQGQVVL